MIGVSNHNLAEIRQADEILRAHGLKLGAVQNHYSLINRSSEDSGILDWCRANGVTFFSYMVLEQGALSGTYDTLHPMPAGSARAATYNPVLDRLEVLNAELARLADKHGVGIAQIPVARAIAKGTLPIVGVTKVSHVEDAVKAASIELAADEIARLEELADMLEINAIRFWEKEISSVKKNIGAALALYPAPTVVVGTMASGKPTWTLVAHAGTMAHSHLMVSLTQNHYINQWIKDTGVLSVNVVDESWLAAADLMGTTSGNRQDKSRAFAYTVGEAGSPIIDDAKVAIECSVEDDYELEGFDNFICRIVATYADEAVLNEKGKIDYHTFKPVLFEFPTYEYFVVGPKAGDCAKMNRGNA